MEGFELGDIRRGDNFIGVLGEREGFIGGENLVGDSGGESIAGGFDSGGGGGFDIILETGVKDTGAGEVLVFKEEIVVLEEYGEV